MSIAAAPALPFDPTSPFGPVERRPLSDVEEAATRALNLSPRPFFFDSIGQAVIDESLTAQFGAQFSGVSFGSFGVTGGAFPDRDVAELPASFAFIDPQRGGADFQVALVNPTGDDQSGSGFGLLSFDPASGQEIEETVDGDTERTQLFNGGFIFAPDDASLVTVGGDELFTIVGGSGDDSISGTGAFVSLLGQRGNDRLEAIDAFAATLTGGAGDDLIAVRQTEQAQINGGAGNDVIEIGNLVRTTGIIVDEFSGDDVVNIGDSAFGDILIGFQEGFSRDQASVTQIDADSFRITLVGEEGSLTINGVSDTAATSVTVAFGERTTFRNQIAQPTVNIIGNIIRPQLRESGFELDSAGNVRNGANGFPITQPGFGLQGPGAPVLSESGEPIFIRLTNLGAPSIDPSNGIPRIATETEIAESAAGRGIQLFENGDIRDADGRPITDEDNNILVLARDPDTDEIIFDADGVPFLQRLLLLNPDGTPATDSDGNQLFQQHTGEELSAFEFDPESEELNIDLLA